MRPTRDYENNTPNIGFDAGKNHEMSLGEFDRDIEKGIIKNKMYIIFGGIFVGIVMFYGIDEDDVKQQRLFDEGDGVSSEYRIRVGGHMYHLGEMVSHWANIAVLTVIGMLFAWMACCACEECKEKVKK